MDREAKIVIISLLMFFALIGAVVYSASQDYQEYYMECISEGVLSNFECKEAAHNMAYGD